MSYLQDCLLSKQTLASGMDAMVTYRWQGGNHSASEVELQFTEGLGSGRLIQSPPLSISSSSNLMLGEQTQSESFSQLYQLCLHSTQNISTPLNWSNKRKLECSTLRCMDCSNDRTRINYKNWCIFWKKIKLYSFIFTNYVGSPIYTVSWTSQNKVIYKTQSLLCL